MPSRPPASETAPKSKDLRSIDTAQLFRACFDCSDSLMVISTFADGRHIEANSAWLDALEYSREEIIGKTAQDLNVWGSADDRKEIIARLEKDGFVKGFEAFLRSKSGQLLSCVISVSRFDTDDETFLLFSAHDMTKRKKLEAELKASEAIQQSAAEQAGLAYWRWSFAEQKLTDWSANYKDVNAYGGTIPESYDDMLVPVHPQDKARVLAVYEQSDIGPDNFDVEYRVIDENGQMRWLREHGEVEYDEAGNAVGHLGILQDISDLKSAQEELERVIGERTRELGSEIEKHRQTEAALHESKSYAAVMIENTAEGMVSIDDKGAIESFNPAAQRIFGYTSEEVVGHNVSLLIPEAERAEHDKYVQDSTLHAPRIINQARDLFGRRKNGDLFPMELNVSRMAIRGESKFIGILHDITDRKLAEEGVLQARAQAEISSRAKSELLANMSHELRTPLNAIIGFSQMFLGETFGSLGHDKYNEYALDIFDSSSHLLELINDILDVSSIEAGKFELHENELDLNRAIRAMIRIIQPRADKDGISLSFIAAKKTPRILGDERRIKQILLNILSNAVKFTRSKGKVDVSTEAGAEGGLVILVSDTGIGMDEDQIALAIEKFGQIDSGHSRRESGTGLGLPLTIALVEQHGGSLAIKSEPGAGTTVAITLPPGRMIK